uniref:Preprotein translocase subunit YajC n=1 Tax=candidate division WOR-3 bacterium TaxID=2052148 RepID=A0A7C4CC32_UNCW3
MLGSAFAQTAEQAGSSQSQPGGLGMLGSLLPLILIVAVLYFLMILPQQRRQKKHQQMLQALKRGDRVVLSGGIFGTVSEVKDGTLMIKVAENTVIEVEKGAVAYRFGTQT